MPRLLPLLLRCPAASCCMTMQRNSWPSLRLVRVPPHPPGARAPPLLCRRCRTRCVWAPRARCACTACTAAAPARSACSNYLTACVAWTRCASRAMEGRLPSAPMLPCPAHARVACFPQRPGKFFPSFLLGGSAPGVRLPCQQVSGAPLLSCWPTARLAPPPDALYCPTPRPQRTQVLLLWRKGV